MLLCGKCCRATHHGRDTLRADKPESLRSPAGNARCERRQHHRTLAAWWGKLEDAERPLLEPKILSRHDPAGQNRRREPAAYLGTILGPHVVRGDERSARL
jgi:hypothetical protein